MGSSRLAKEYWRQYIKDIKPCFFPCTTSGDMGHYDVSASLESISIPFHETDELRIFAERHTLESSEILRTAWALVLRQYTDSDEVCFGVHYRRRDETMSAICRLHINPTDKICDVLSKAQRDALESEPYRIDLLKAILQTASGPSLPDFCNSAILEQDGMSVDSAIEPVDYVAALHIGGSDELVLRYQPSAMEDLQALSIAHTFSKTLSSIVSAEATRTVSDVDMFSEHDRETVTRWNDPQVKLIDACVHQMVARQVDQSPDDQAVCSYDGDLTYRELARLSSRLAYHLKDFGVGPEIIVPLCFDKSKWNVVAQLAVLKAGGACASVDPLHPQNRLNGILDDTEACVVITEPKYTALFKDRVHTVALSPSLFDCLPGDQVAKQYTYDSVRPNHAAFVVFTSGSTGKPKGIVQEHGAYCTSMVESIPVFASKAGRRHLQFAAHTFDNSISDVFVTLANGGCICIPSEYDRMNNLVDAIKTMDCNQAEITPTVARLLRPEDIPSMEVLMLTGESATKENLRTWGNIPKVNLINIYGPAEATILTTVKFGLRPDTHPLDIGYAVGGHCWITDSHDYHQLAPIGAIGELLLDGPLLARGYLNDKEKTDAAFVRNPRWTYTDGSNALNQACRVVYRTGDLARYNVDGSIHLIGRKDTQIKLRGQRIELGGVEYQLCTSNDVRHGVVVFPESGLCSQSLVAILSFHDIPNTRSGQDAVDLVSTKHLGVSRQKLLFLREFLATRLPTYMIPTMWLVLESLPLLTSGKLNRKLLKTWVNRMSESELIRAKELALMPRQSSGTRRAPNTEAEKLLLKVCSHVLNFPTDEIDLDDSFLRLGGDSISAMSMKAKCQSEGKLSFSVQDILQRETLAELARYAKPLNNTVSIVTMRERSDTLFELSPIQRIFFASSPEGSHEYTQSFLLKSRKYISPHTLETAFETLVERHSMLRARFQRPKLHEPWKQFIPSYKPRLYQINYLQLTTLDEMHKVMATTWSTINIVEGPVFSVNTCDIRGFDGQLLFLTAHHLIMDLVSWRIILRDLEDIIVDIGSKAMEDKSHLNGFTNHKQHGLMHGSNHVPKINEIIRSERNTEEAVRQTPLSFQVWNQMQGDRIHGTRLSGTSTVPRVSPVDLDYWGMAQLPNQFQDAETLRFSLDKETTKLLLGDCNEALKTEPIDIFLGVILHAFAQSFQDRKTPTFFNESHGREAWDESLDLSRTVGWFTTMFPVSIQPDWEDVIETICRAKDIRRSFPDRGWYWFSSQVLASQASTSAVAQSMEVIFNYFGIYQQLERKDALFLPFAFTGVQPTEEGGPQVPRPSLFELALTIDYGALQANLTYNRKMRQQDRIRSWVHTSEKSFFEVAHRMSKMTRQLTLSDVPFLPTTYAGLRILSNTVLPTLNVPLSNVEDVYACSPMQQGLLVSRLKHPEYYDIHWTFEVCPSKPGQVIDTSTILAAWQKVVDRHTIMRTLLVEDICGEGDFGQVVLKSATARVKLTIAKDGQAALEAVKDHPKMRYQGSELPHQLLVCPASSTGSLFCQLAISHAITDGISLSLLMRDLVLAYGDKLPDTKSLPYRDFVSHVLSQSLEPALNYWKEYLSDVKPCCLPVSDVADEADMELRSIEVPLKGVENLSKFCRQHGITSTTVIHAIWILVLRGYTGMDVPCFGFLSSGRDLAVDGIEDAMGPFISLLVCRMAISDEHTILRILKSIQVDTHRSLNYQTCSLGKIQHALGHSGRSLFNTAMSQEKHFDQDTSTEASASIQVHSVHDPTEYDLAVHVYESKKGLSVVLKYWIPKLSDQQVKDIASTFATIFSSILADPKQEVKNIKKCSTRDLLQVREWNGSPFPLVDARVHDLVFERSLLHPHAEAICSWDGAMTYSEMDEASSRFARHIMEAVPSIKPEVFVPLCFLKSMWQPVAMLAVLKTGAAFVTLDPSHPMDRLRSIVQDVGARVVLSSSQLSQLCSELIDKTIIVGAAELASLPAVGQSLDAEVVPSNAAYAIFTSGSTGKPKGSVIEHKAYSSNIWVQQKQLHIESNTRALQFASYAFDSFLLESLTILALGGCVCIPHDDERLDDIGAAMRRMDVTWANMTPSFANLLSPSEVPHLKVLVSGGEALPAAVLHKWANAVHLCNSYGPSECCVSSVIKSHVTDSTSPSDIGQGAGALTWIVDAANHDRLAPVGSIGELLLEGPILAREYLNEKAKTDAAFISNPAWTQEVIGERRSENRRFYKTGDLVRYNFVGDITYLGRKDTQVKIHGQRLEIGEIEHHVTNAPHVRHAVTAYLEAGPFKKTLVATLSLDNLPKPQTSGKKAIEIVSGASRVDHAAEATKQLRNYLSDRLPKYMVPRTIVVVEAMPLSTTGKLDRRQIEKFLTEASNETQRRIAKISDSAWSSKDKSEPPSTPAEKKLHSVWSRVLNVSLEEIGINSSFLRLGGDSISALQLVAKCRQEGIKISVQDVLRTKSLAELARGAILSTSLATIDTGIVETPYHAFDLSPIQQMYFDLAPKENNHITQSFFLRCKQYVEVHSLSEAVHKLVSTHAMLRARFKPAEDGQWRQLITAGNGPQAHHLRHHRVDSIDNARPIAEQTRAYLSITSGPIFAAVIFSIGDEQFIFLTAHHLVVDLVSWRIILQDLEELLRSSQYALTASMSFQSWCRLQGNHARALSPELTLPLSLRPETKKDDDWGMVGRSNKVKDLVSRSFTMDPDHTDLLLGICNEVFGTEPVELFHASVFQSFYAVFGYSPAIFHEGHGREPFDDNIDLSRTVGWFTTVYPVSVPVEAAEDIFDIVRRTKDSRRSIPSNGRPYFASRYLNPEGRDQFQKLAPEIALNYHGRFQQLEGEDALFEQMPISGLISSDDDPNANRLALIDIEISIEDGRLLFTFLYNRHMTKQSLFGKWIEHCKNSLGEIVTLHKYQSAQYTLTDFPLFRDDYPVLQRLLRVMISPNGDFQRDEIEDIYPCSPMQQDLLLSQSKGLRYYQGMWLWEISHRCSEIVDPCRLQRAWQEVVERHALLRTVFVRDLMQQDHWDQVVLRRPDIKVSRLFEKTATTARRALQDWPAFDYPNLQPLHRLIICAASEGKVLCRLDISHAINDGTAMEVLLRDWSRAYDGDTSQATGRDSHFRDYIAYLQSSQREVLRGYWTTYLTGLIPCHFPLSTSLELDDRSRRQQSFPVKFPESLDLPTFCEANSTTLANLIRTVWALVLRRYTQADAVCFGYLVYGRDVPIEGPFEIAGPLFNTLVCESHIKGTMSLTELLQNMQQDYIESLPHQNCSFAEMQRTMIDPPGTQGERLFNTLVNHRRTVAPLNADYQSLTFKEIECQDPMDYAIVLEITQDENDIHINISYWRPDITEVVVKKMSAEISAMLESIVQNPDQMVEQFSAKI